MFNLLLKIFPIPVLLFLFSCFNYYYLVKLIDLIQEQNINIEQTYYINLIKLTAQLKNDEAAKLLLHNFYPTDHYISTLAYTFIQYDNVKLFSIIINNKYRLELTHDPFELIVKYNAINILDYLIKLGINCFQFILDLTILYDRYTLFNNIILFKHKYFWNDENAILRMCLRENKINMAFFMLKNFQIQQNTINLFLNKIAHNKLLLQKFHDILNQKNLEILKQSDTIKQTT